MKKIAVIGVGIMGAGMASNFLRGGHEVYVWNRSPERLGPLVEKGATVLESPKQGAELADIIFEVTANDESSRSVWTGPEGILAGATPEKVVIASSTLSVDWATELAELCTQKGLTFFDMPLTGGRGGAESGQLTLLVGGDESKLEELRPTLSAIAKKVTYFGKAGSGMKYKLLLNMLQAIHIAGFGEAMRIAKAHGMNLKAVGDSLAEHPGGTTTNVAWRDYQVEPKEANFSVKWITKDLGYAKRFAGAEDLPLLENTLKRYLAAVEAGLGEDDWTAINRV